MPLAPSLDTAGFLARDFSAFARTSSVLFGEAAEAPVRLIRFPVLEGLLLPEAESKYWRLVRLAAAAVGSAVESTVSHGVEDLYWCFRRIQGFEAWASHGGWISQADRHLGPGVKERFEAGAQVSGETYAAESTRRGDFRAELADLLSEDGVALLPTVPGPAPLAGSTPDEFAAYRERALKMLCWAGLAGLPQVALPLGRVEAAPFGISLLGPPGSDARLVALAGGIAGEASWTR